MLVSYKKKMNIYMCNGRPENFHSVKDEKVNTASPR